MTAANKIIDYFSSLKKTGKLGTAYLFIGRDFSLADDVAKLAICPETAAGFCSVCWDCRHIAESEHPDFLVVEPLASTVTISQVREVQSFLAMKAFRAVRKIVMIRQAETMGPDAANAFLKTLEEPPKNSLIMLCVSRLDGILPTILSRCRKIFLPFGEGIEQGAQVKVLSGFLQGERMKFDDRRKFAGFVWTMIVFLRDYIVKRSGQANNSLLTPDDYEIILKLFEGRQTPKISSVCGLLDEVMMIYQASDNVNMNLALNIMKMKVGQLAEAK